MTSCAFVRSCISVCAWQKVSGATICNSGITSDRLLPLRRIPVYRTLWRIPGVIIPLRVNKETVRSLRVEDEQAVPGIIIASDSVFVLCDEIIVSQQCAAEQPEPLAWQLDDLIHGTGVCLTPGLLTLQFCLNDHIIPPISMWLLWLPFITSSML